ncbi:hypothetical protein GGR56DRAFT_677654 [Xylariaceae sp. FL0804]|nr:hypothetical protein GGR56DRAFT_677654 [Xylariaceae sp. FL0804]
MKSVIKLVTAVAVAATATAAAAAVVPGGGDLLGAQQSAAGVVAEWTISDAARVKSADNATCAWHLVLTPDSPPSTTTSSAAPSSSSQSSSYPCDFVVAAPAAGGDCGLATLPATACSGNPAFDVALGHSDLGFVVMVVSRNGEQAYAGFADAALDAGAPIAPQTVGAHEVGVPDSDRRRRRGDTAGVADTDADARRAVATTTTMAAADVMANALATGQTWTVEAMYRNVNATARAIELNFYMRAGNGSYSVCHLDLQAPQGVDDLATWQWYDRQCEGNEYYASWGYLPAGDAGVMTLVRCVALCPV